MSNRPLFLAATFLLMLLSFYIGLALNAFTTPYLEPHLGVKFFTDFLEMGLIYAGSILGLIALMTIGVTQFSRKHYFFLLALALPATFVSAYFFVAFFGI